jgi:hypothetical protein
MTERQAPRTSDIAVAVAIGMWLFTLSAGLATLLVVTLYNYGNR